MKKNKKISFQQRHIEEDLMDIRLPVMPDIKLDKARVKISPPSSPLVTPVDIEFEITDVKLSVLKDVIACLK